MTKQLTLKQLKELLQIQNDFDSRIETINIADTQTAYVVEFFEWFNTIETFKNWKKNPGKPIEEQLDELSDMLAFGLSLVNQENVSDEDLQLGLNNISKDEYYYNKSQAAWDFMKDVSMIGLDPISAVITPLDIAYNIYTIDDLIKAYKKKMKRNHDRQNGTADTGKGYV